MMIRPYSNLTVRTWCPNSNRAHVVGRDDIPPTATVCAWWSVKRSYCSLFAVAGCDDAPTHSDMLAPHPLGRIIIRPFFRSSGTIPALVIRFSRHSLAEIVLILTYIPSCCFQRARFMLLMYTVHSGLTCHTKGGRP